MFTKKERSSPSISHDALMVQMMINGHHKRDVATADEVGDFLEAFNDESVLLYITGDMIDIMIQENPSLAIGTTTDKRGNRVLIMVVTCALYGCVKSSILWYDLFTNVLQKMIFELNPVESCIANAMIN
uniref:Uncharacterized protein n=1 Tax=Eucampia antarctica TaxID=49252 RepID=A0A7S2R3K7_9STRA|mmetsp:Transcript_15865/g.15265  ORF Transcript_15865/g.15265 Transcript_15865/m.15265 type:complete len:129 (+) Transcript_15865:1385-1771(+)